MAKRTKQIEPILALDQIAERLNQSERTFRKSDAFRLGVYFAVRELAVATALVDNHCAETNAPLRFKESSDFGFRLWVLRTYAHNAVRVELPPQIPPTIHLNPPIPTLREEDA